ncbi:DUF2213 domain-containing protein [Xanthobacter sp. V3C-3]|uniref:DUF2213 domain-containing protein n=1 Tax=Xanthobacter lutulentifluminis TaxID=3119935 RepID=UPI00372B42A4
MTRYTLDRAPVTLVAEQIGRSQSVTPDGFLLCEGVRIARTGPMLYRPEEVPEIEPNPNGAMVTLLRDADVLFAPETIASFVGKPVTNDHPSELVGPDTWRDVSGGVVLNVRRGEGADSEHLVADLLVTDASCIADVRAGKREVSCGYDTEAETVSPGLGRVTKIVGNHVALVDRGRCGPSCAILDEDTAMAKEAKRTVWDRLVTAFKANDEAAFQEELEAAKGENEGQHIHVHVNGQPEAEEPKKDEAETAEPDDWKTRMEAAIAAIAEQVAKMQRAGAEEPIKDEDPAPEKEEEEKSEVKDEKPEEEEEKKPVMDAAALNEQFRDTISRAEILAPGLSLPKFDAKSPRLMVDAMCQLRVKALSTAFDNESMRPHVAAIAGAKPDFKKMTCDQAALVFRGASELAKVANTRGGDTAAPLQIGGAMTAAKYSDRFIKPRRGN